MTLVRELAQECWDEYLDAVSRDMLNTSVSIEMIPSAGQPTVPTEWLALQALAYDRRRDVFEVATATGSARLPGVVRHIVDHPARIAVDRLTLLAPLTIGVDGADGARTLIRIQPQADFAG